LVTNHYELTDKGLKVRIRLTPNASHNKIHAWQQDETGKFFLKVSVTTIPENGKANKAMIKLLSKTLKIAKSNIQIIAGETDRNKTLLITGINQLCL
jgi:uncharacterized protein